MFKTKRNLKKKILFSLVIFQVIVLGYFFGVPSNALGYETGSITVCKIIIDEQSNITNGLENQGTFVIPGLIRETSTGIMATSTFNTPLNLNTNVIGNDQINDAQCIIYNELDFGSYHYGAEIVTGDNWQMPLYNDQYNVQVSSLSNLFIPTHILTPDDLTDDAPNNHNMDTDGNIVISQNRPDRVLLILNQYEQPDPICGDGIVNQPSEQCDGGPDCSVNCQIEQCVEPETIVINEIMQNPSAVSDTSGEWFELYNTTGEPIDIAGCTIRDNVGDSHIINKSVIVPSLGYAVLARNASSSENGGVVADYKYSRFTLGNRSDEVVLECCNQVIDQVEYDDGATFPDPKPNLSGFSASMILNSPLNNNNVGSNWCESVSPFGAGDFGTPGSLNDSCGGDPDPICGDGVLDQGEQCDDGNLTDGDGCSAICELEELDCDDLEGETGWYGEYFNYPASHDDMDLPSIEWPDITHGDPLGTWNADWYTQPYFRFSRVDSNLNFGADFFPFDMAQEEEHNGHEYHFGAHWQAKVTAPAPGNYAYTLTSDDDAWVYVDGVLVIDNAGIHSPTTATGTFALTNEHIVDVFFAERHIVRSHLVFDITGVLIEPYQEECEGITVCKIILDSEGNVTDGTENQGITLTIPWTDINGGTTTVFTTPLNLNTNILGGGSDDAECVTYKNLDIATYHYLQEQISDDTLWLTPLYNDQTDKDVTSTDSFFEFNVQNNNSDGVIGLTAQRPSRTFVILNRLNIQTDYNPYCGDGIVNQVWEGCDDGIDGSQECTEQCQIPSDECSDLALAKINIDNVNNWYGGDMTSDIYLGASDYVIPQGVWFALFHNGVYFIDSDIDPYEDVPGLAIERQEGRIRALLYGTHQIFSDPVEHIDGFIEFYNSTPISQASDDSGNNKLEKGFDGNGVGSFLPGDDEVWLNNGESRFWLTVNSADDGFYTNYGIIELCEPEEEVTICHFSPGDPGNPQTITVVESAVQTHLDHGDSLGPCDDPTPPGGGAVINPVFHGGGQDATSTISVVTLAILNDTIQVVALSSTSVAIYWETDSPGTSLVIYSEEGQPHAFDSTSPLTYGYAYVTEEIDLDPKVISHQVIITGLTPAIVYYFRAISKASPAANSEEFSFILAVDDEEETEIRTGEVKECPYLLDYLKIGEDNNPVEVSKLQLFLNEYEGAGLEVIGVFDIATDLAVKAFQAKYNQDILNPWGTSQPTGYVYITTRNKVNEIYCDQQISLTSDQQSEIDRVKSVIGALVEQIKEIAEEPNEKTKEEIEEQIEEIEELIGQLEGEKQEDSTEFLADISDILDEEEEQEQKQQEPDKLQSFFENALSKIILLFD